MNTIGRTQVLPKYSFTNYFGSGSTTAMDFHSPLARKYQIIYRPSELPGLPGGPLRSVYFRVGRTYGPFTPNPTVYDTIRIKMGYTQDATFKDTMMHGFPYTFFMTGLVQVFFQTSFSVYGADSIGTWVRFPIDGFNYDPNTNLVVELFRGNQTINQGFDWMLTRTCYRCRLGAFYDSSLYVNASAVGNQADIGFNDSTASVGGLSTLKGFYAYPNPSQGLFTVGFEPSGGNASSVQVSVSDMAGRQVWQRSYQDVRADLFTANIDLRSRPKGIYLLRVQAGEAQALQRVVVE